MHPRRRALLTLASVALIGGSMYDMVRDQEHWPFSQYPMFAHVWRAPSFNWLRLFGVTDDGREFPLDANRYVQPYDQSRLPKALRRILEDPARTPRLDEALAGFLARYDALAQLDVHDGPPLVAIRLYELEWTIDPAAANVDRPDRRRFIAEVRRP